MYDYILDGTNICHVGSPEGPSLIPVFQITSYLLTEGKTFVCYFDESTPRQHLNDDLDRAIYYAITQAKGRATPLFARGLFVQVSGKKADEEVLARAREFHHALVISSDRFDEEQYQEQYGWDQEQRYARLLTVHTHKGELTLIKPRGSTEAIIKSPPPKLDLYLMTLNQIEGKYDRLRGQITEVQLATQTGKILRNLTIGGQLNFHSSGIIDPGLAFPNSAGQRISFSIGAHFSKKKKWIFQAENIIPLPDPERELEERRIEVKEMRRMIARMNEQQQEIEAERDELAEKVELLTSQEDHAEVLLHMQTKHAELEAVHQKSQAENAQLRKRIAELVAELERLQRLLSEGEVEKKDLSVTVGYLATREEQLEEELFALKQEDENTDLGTLRQVYLSLQTDYRHLLQRWEESQAQTRVWSHVSPVANLQADIVALQREVADLRAENDELRTRMRITPIHNGEAMPSEGIFQVIDEPEPPVVRVNGEAPSTAHLTWWVNLSQDLRAYFAFAHQMDVDRPRADILRAIHQKTSLNLHGPSTTEELAAKMPVVRDLTGIGALIQVEVLNLSFHEIDSLAELSSLKNLRELYLVRNRLRDLRGVEHLSNLQELFLENNQLTTLDGVEQLSRLADLNVRNNPNLSAEAIDRLQLLRPDLFIRR